MGIGRLGVIAGAGQAAGVPYLNAVRVNSISSKKRDALDNRIRRTRRSLDHGSATESRQDAAMVQPQRHEQHRAALC